MDVCLREENIILGWWCTTNAFFLFEKEEYGNMAEDRDCLIKWFMIMLKNNPLILRWLMINCLKEFQILDSNSFTTYSLD